MVVPVTFDLKTAKALLQDSYSGVKLITRAKTLLVPPCYIGDIRKGIVDLLNLEVKQYSTTLEGVLIGYENVKLKCKNAEFMDSSPCCLVNIVADFIVFGPQVGDMLKGVVNKTSYAHIGCIVNGLYNVSLPRKDYVPLGSEVLFKVTHLDFKNRIVFMRGELVSITKLNEGPNNYLAETDDGYGSEMIPSGVSGSSMDETLESNSGLSRKQDSHVFFSDSDDSDDDEDDEGLKKLEIDKENDSIVGEVVSDNEKDVTDKNKRRNSSDKLSPCKKKRNKHTGGETKKRKNNKKSSKTKNPTKVEDSETKKPKKDDEMKEHGEGDDETKEWTKDEEVDKTKILMQHEDDDKTKKRKNDEEDNKTKKNAKKQKRDSVSNDADTKKRKKKDEKTNTVSDGGLTEEEKNLLKMLKAKEKKFRGLNKSSTKKKKKRKEDASKKKKKKASKRNSSNKTKKSERPKTKRVKKQPKV